MKWVSAAVERFGMIQDKDHLVLGMSGGKDSYLMLDELLRLQKVAPVKFTMECLTVDGFGADFSLLGQHIKARGLAHTIIKAGIKEKLAEMEGSPGDRCFICARVRKGIMLKFAREKKAKLALGHTLDDFMETLLMNMMFLGRKDSMQPFNEKLGIIRPLILVSEVKQGYPIVDQKCGHTNGKREKIRGILADMKKEKQYIGACRKLVIDA